MGGRLLGVAGVGCGGAGWRWLWLWEDFVGRDGLGTLCWVLGAGLFAWIVVFGFVQSGWVMVAREVWRCMRRSAVLDYAQVLYWLVLYVHVPFMVNNNWSC